MWLSSGATKAWCCSNVRSVYSSPALWWLCVSCHCLFIYSRWWFRRRWHQRRKFKRSRPSALPATCSPSDWSWPLFSTGVGLWSKPITAILIIASRWKWYICPTVVLFNLCVCVFIEMYRKGAQSILWRVSDAIDRTDGPRFLPPVELDWEPRLYLPCFFSLKFSFTSHPSTVDQMMIQSTWPISFTYYDRSTMCVFRWPGHFVIRLTAVFWRNWPKQSTGTMNNRSSLSSHWQINWISLPFSLSTVERSGAQCSTLVTRRTARGARPSSQPGLA